MVRYLADVHFPGPASKSLKKRGVDLITAQEDGSDRLEDLELLRRATRMSRILVTQDEDLLREGALLMTSGEPFAGIIFARQNRFSIGELVQQLELVAVTTTSADWISRIAYLPIAPLRV